MLFRQNYGSLDAATLVFIHSVLDELVFDYCRVTALHAPEDWEDDLKQVQISLLEAKNKTYNQILTAKIEKHLEKLARESLCTKTDRLFARCQPSADWSPMESYSFDRDRIQEFDKQRHEIIHGRALGKPLSIFTVSDESLHYLMQTGLYLA